MEGFIILVFFVFVVGMGIVIKDAISHASIHHLTKRSGGRARR